MTLKEAPINDTNVSSFAWRSWFDALRRSQADGVYTPTWTNIANCASLTAFPCQYLKIGHTVTVSGQLGVTATAGAPTLTQARATLPLSTNLSNTYDLAGTIASGGVSAYSGAMFADTTNDQAEASFMAQDTNARTLFFTFTYRIA